ncbi:cytokine receptor [Drosophila persimilis]|nr:cytokine receptor [Drosophila persimilis]
MTKTSQVYKEKKKMHWSWVEPYLAMLVLSLNCQLNLASLTVSREEIRAGDSFNVTCSWDDESVSPEHIKIKVAPRGNRASNRMETNTTVVERVDNATVGKWHYECMWDGKTLESLDVRVGARLQVEDFECRMDLYDSTMMTSCSFSMPNGYQLEEDFLYLRENELPPVQCTDYPHNATQVLCRIDPGLTPKTKFETSHSYTLNMRDSVGNQTQHFNRTQAQVLVLDWPNKKQPLTPFDNQSCLIWQNSVWSEHYHQSGSIDWHVRVIPLNDEITEIENPSYEVRYSGTRCEMFCLKTPPYPNQQFELHLRRRFNQPEAPWSETITRQFWVPKSKPSRPPRLLPNGFFFDPRSKGLYIFWEQLKPLEHNGPNLTYSLATTDGKHVSHVGRNFAMFPHWDGSTDSTISVCSENSEGRSLNCSDLYVPVLDNAKERQPTALKYDKATNTLSWTAPERSSGLLHYTVYWCSPVNDTQKICDDSQDIKLLELDGASRQEHHFNGSMELINLGVAATYGDKFSGGMRWLRVGLPTEVEVAKSRYLEGIVALIVLCLIFISYRKLHRCSGIEIDIPNGVYEGQRGITGVKHDEKDVTKVPTQGHRENHKIPKETNSGIELVVIEDPKECIKPIPVTVKPSNELTGFTMPDTLKNGTNPISDLKALCPTESGIENTLKTPGRMVKDSAVENYNIDDTKDATQDPPVNAKIPTEPSSGIELAVIEDPKEYSRPIPVTVKPWNALIGRMADMVRDGKNPNPDLEIMLPIESRNENTLIKTIPGRMGTTQNAKYGITPPTVPNQIETVSDIRTTPEGYMEMLARASKSGSGSVSDSEKPLPKSNPGYVQIELNKSTNGNGYVMPPPFR